MVLKKENKNKVFLLILDGVGVNKEYLGNAPFLAKTKTLDNLVSKYPYLELGASEEHVGLLKGQLGGSEVGHLTIGAGKIINSDLMRIHNAIKDKSFFKNKTLNSAFKIKKGNNLHLIGLLSDGGIHSHINHLFALLDFVKQKKLNKVYIHVFSDGRDVSPKSLLTYISKLKEYIYKKKLEHIAEVASISGRYFGMDRDNKWDRLKKVYDLLIEGKGNLEDSKAVFIKKSYKKGITDEFLEPTLFLKDGLIKKNDTIIYFNFRSDRAREFTRLFVDNKFKEFKIKRQKVNFYTLTQFDSKFKDAKVIFTPLKVKDGLGQIISKKGYKQLRAAETEKFAHVTYFFNQGQEHPNKGEDRILVPSPKVATYDLKPEMSLPTLVKKIIPTLKKNYKLYVANFANGDMVGHTGNISATVKALEAVDLAIEKIVKNLDENTTLIITADHGNCDEMFFKDKSISTSHSLSKVPFILVSNKFCLNSKIKNPTLANIAPTILDVLDMPIVKDMEPSLLEK
jgi:2,3-bisphosphoglycerate-independent phosphoglycerate mutase